MPDDHRELDQASTLIRHVMERHRSEDLRLLSLLTAAIQDIRVGKLYLYSDDDGPLAQRQAS